jgi:hypothetical protein
MNHPTPLWRRTSVRIAAVAVAIPVLALAWYLGSPLILDRTVIEDFPEVEAISAAGDAAAQTDDASAETAGPTAGDVDATAEPASSTVPSDTEASAEEMADPAVPAEPVALYQGAFQGADDSHRGSGTATIYELADGSRILRFEDLDVTNGPDLHVIVSPTASVENRDDVMTPGYVDLGSLKGNLGDQNYELPDDLDLSGDFTVTIYCQPFHVVFATAELSASSA